MAVFDHQNYTGRSGTMYGYEGIGSIYWHMVSKLLLATQELYFKAVKINEDINTLKNLGGLYYKIRSGLSSDKTPKQYGAFPYDPYSHTPFKRGAQQPGMTGQVKEELITRMGELGCIINNGKLNWSNNNDYPFNSNIKKHKDKIFVIDYKNTLRCFKIRDGSECWNLQTEDSFTISNIKSSNCFLISKYFFDIYYSYLKKAKMVPKLYFLGDTYNFSCSINLI